MNARSVLIQSVKYVILMILTSAMNVLILTSLKITIVPILAQMENTMTASQRNVKTAKPTARNVLPPLTVHNVRMVSTHSDQ